MVNFGPLAAEIDAVVWAPLQISTGFASWQPYCTALEHWALATLCGIEQRAPPIFDRAAITLGIGPHSSFFLHLDYNEICPVLLCDGTRPYGVGLY